MALVLTLEADRLALDREYRKSILSALELERKNLAPPELVGDTAETISSLTKKPSAGECDGLYASSAKTTSFVTDGCT